MLARLFIKVTGCPSFVRLKIIRGINSFLRTKVENMLQRLSCNSPWFKFLCLSKMKELNQLIFGRRLFASIKEHLCLRKEHMDNLEG